MQIEGPSGSTTGVVKLGSVSSYVHVHTLQYTPLLVSLCPYVTIGRDMWSSLLVFESDGFSVFGYLSQHTGKLRLITACHFTGELPHTFSASPRESLSSRLMAIPRARAEATDARTTLSVCSYANLAR